MVRLMFPVIDGKSGRIEVISSRLVIGYRPMVIYEGKRRDCFPSSRFDRWLFRRFLVDDPPEYPGVHFLEIGLISGKDNQSFLQIPSLFFGQIHPSFFSIDGRIDHPFGMFLDIRVVPGSPGSLIHLYQEEFSHSL